MKTISWNTSLSIQLEEVDADHRKILDLFNILIIAISEEEKKSYIDAVLDELISCTAWHFKHEERLMLKYNYNKYDEHKIEHNELIESANKLQQKLIKNEGAIKDEDIKFLEQWLIGHIYGADMEMGEYLIEEM